MNPCLAREYVRQIGGFDEVIDVRSPAEFEDDHIPGASEFCHSAIPPYYPTQLEYEPTRASHSSLLASSLTIIAVNLPVLDNAERAEVGTLHNSRVKWHI